MLPLIKAIMDIQQLKEEISEKELRLSQLRNMDTHKLKAEDRNLIQELEEQISQLKEKLNEE